MTGLAKSYKTDKEKEVNGTEIPIDDAQNEDGTVPTFIVARAGRSNTAYTKALETATRPYRRQMELKQFSNENAERVMLDVFIATILKGWKNVQNAAGESIAFTPANAKALMQEYPDIYDRLNTEAGTVANFIDTQREEEAKN